MAYCLDEERVLLLTEAGGRYLLKGSIYNFGKFHNSGQFIHGCGTGLSELDELAIRSKATAMREVTLKR